MDTRSNDPPRAAMMRYTPKPGLLETELPGELILLDPETQEMFSLNETGRLVWRTLPADTLGEAVDRVVSAFAVEREAAERDVGALVLRLREAGLLRTDDERG